MSEFNRMTVVAAVEVIESFNTHASMEILAVEWGISGRVDSTSKSARVASTAKIALDAPLEVMTENGRMSLTRAVVEKAIQAPSFKRDTDAWRKFIAGLRFDGFEVMITETEVAPRSIFGSGETKVTVTLVRMLPQNIPGVDFREAESEVVMLLDRSGFQVAKGHLDRAVSAFQRGEWSGANGELRNFYESYLNEIADGLGYSGIDDSKARRDFLGKVQPPFLLEEYNEWSPNKSQFVQGLMSRMHPHGGHPGLSEEEDATFRLQVSLVTARLFLRRYYQRKNP